MEISNSNRNQQAVFSDNKTTSSPAEKRNANLDLLRTVAIIMVVIYHVVQMSPIGLPKVIADITSFGQYGVDLFFVLSGWLIGGLYWKEFKKFGNVELARFWGRRWLRTIPPYIVGLVISWLAVWIARSQKFDFGYLLFLQNYYAEIPFFLISWSLCIEEHFYLFMPLIMLPLLGHGRWINVLFCVLILVPPVCRLLNEVEGEGFGFDLTATHLRMEGLLLGFWLSRIQLDDSILWRKMIFWGRRVGIAAVILLVLVCLAGGRWMYLAGLTFLSVGLGCLLVALQGLKPGRVASSQVVGWIAVTSYSVYLTHALVIHCVRLVVMKLPSGLYGLYFPVVLAMIAVSGAVFYLLVERVSVLLRDKWVPRRL